MSIEENKDGHNVEKKSLDRDFINKWVNIAKPALKEINFDDWPGNSQHEAEKKAILNSVANLKTFPWIEDAIKNKKLRVVDTETNTEVEEEMLSAVIVEHKGNKVRVGSGFSIDQRREYFADPSKIMFKTITVQYFEESKNQDGEYSLRFPVVKFIYDKKRDC